MHFDVMLSAGKLPIMTVGEPGAQGAAVTGIQGIGVSTPIAAAVADATVGFASDMQTPNGGMFAMGLLSMIVAAGVPAMTVGACSALRTLGATPNVHIIVHPVVANGGMGIKFSVQAF